MASMESRYAGQHELCCILESGDFSGKGHGYRLLNVASFGFVDLA